MIVQIYAVTSVEEALVMADAGVDHVGFIAGEYGLVHGELSFEKARAIADALRARGGAKSVALTVSTDLEEIERMADAVEPDIVHISSEPFALDVPSMKLLRRHVRRGIDIMKAIGVEDESSIEVALRFAPVCDWLLLDTAPPGEPWVGATGRVHDWDVSRRIIERMRAGADEKMDRPVIMAGGLNPENVVDAIEATAPFGVDSNTATNVPGDPVKKDPGRVRAFVQAVRRWEAEKEGGE